MRFFHTPIDVELDRQRRPRLILWQRRRYRVTSVTEVWVTRRGWWAGEEERVFMRVETDRAQLVIYRCGLDGEEWWLYQMTD